MSARRYLCSELVLLKTNFAEFMVNLEEIWRNGAVFESERSLEQGVRVEMRTARSFFAGRVTRVGWHEFGWRVEVEFSPLTLWSPERFHPRHLLDVSGSEET